MKSVHGVVVALAFLSTPVLASAQDVDVGGQVRPRFEFRDPSFTGGGFAGEQDAFTSMRARIHVDAQLKQNIRVFAQVQDVRLWGSESGTLVDFNADNFDLHQGYIDLVSNDTVWLARAGRHEINLGGQRLVGAVDWAQPARSFDGVRLQRMKDGTGALLLASQLADATSGNHSNDRSLVVGYGRINNLLAGALGLYAIYNTANGSPTTDEGTFGFRQVGSPANFRYRLESYYQTGTALGMDVSAFMVAARLGMVLGKGTVTLWYDYLSGDNDLTDNTTKVFNTLFATNHKFYGYADLFLVIPVNTGGRGLQDVAIKGSYAPTTSTLIKLDAHAFRAAQQGTLTSKRFGEEIDLVGQYTFSENLTFSGGAAYVFQGPALAEIGRLDKDMVWIYLMVDATF